jgi:diguanylate cyclase (GGDEF)-like protein
MWRVRWICAVFALAQFVLYRPPPGVVVPFNRAVVGPIIAFIIVCTNLASLAARRIEDPRRLSLIGTAQLAADGIVATAVVWLFTFDRQSALWAVLILVVIEGAIRAQLKGAMLTWGALAAAYAGREVWASSHYPGARFQIESVTYRMGIVLIVAAATGYLSKNLQARIREQLASRRKSEQRAELLHTVAATSRGTSTLDVDALFSSIIEATSHLGFDATAIALIDDATDSFRLAAQRGVPFDFVQETHSASTGLVGVVRAQRDTVILEHYSTWPQSQRQLRGLALRAVAACPIFSGSQLEAVLIAGSATRDAISKDESECLELLATHCGAALTNVHRFTERHKLEEQLQHHAFHDSLTDLPNRTLFLDRLNHCLERKSRAASPTAVLFIDLDGFKRINDSLGHHAGDEALQAVTRRLESGRRVGDTVARWGGDEFTILVEDPHSYEGALESAQRIVEQLREPLQIRSREVFLSASVGVAFGSREPGFGHEFVREADVAMYWAKERGGNGCEVYRPNMIARAEQRMDMELQLRHALEHGMFMVHYQPVMDAETKRVVGLEALARWNHATRGLLAACEFIDLAEERDLIIRLGHWMVDAVCKQIGEWRAAHPEWPHIPVAINLSPKELRQPDFVEHVVAALDRYGVNGHNIAIEVTERALVDPATTLDQMERLRELGVRMIIDDFGLGYSSLAYLKQFPFSILKVDKSFIAGVTHVEADQAIVRSVLALARDLKIPVVAEGVENEDQLRYLQELGCQYMQGYHLHRPVAAAAIPALIAPAALSA